jgi:Tol biopolymer transport system component
MFFVPSCLGAFVIIRSMFLRKCDGIGGAISALVFYAAGQEGNPMKNAAWFMVHHKDTKNTKKHKGACLCVLVSLASLWFAASFMFAGPQGSASAEKQLEAAIHREVVLGDLKGAIEQYKKILAQNPKSRAVAAQALFHMGQCQEKLGQAEARKAYERVVRDFADQAEIVAQARVRLAALGGPAAGGGLVTRRVLTYAPDASDVDEMLTPDGKYLSHLDRDTGDLVQFDVASGQTSRITNRGPWSENDKSSGGEELSRDGKQIVYESWPKDNVPQLHIRNLDGSGLRTLYREKGSYAYPMDWSPDGGSILAFRSRDKAKELTLISTADGSVRVLKTLPFNWSREASFSPDGRFVAFSSLEGSPPNIDVFLMTADGRNEVVVAGHPAEDYFLEWTPDGRSLVFLSDRSGTWDIWSVHITGGKQQGEPELLKKDFGYHPSVVIGFAPDGSLYYEARTPDLGGLCNGAVDLETGKVVVPPAPVTTRHTGIPARLTWSPDGRNLAYLSRPGTGPGNYILTIRSAATGEERLLWAAGRVDQISWAPDGRSVIALNRTSGKNGIIRIDAETIKITELADEGRFGPLLCPDGKTLVFVVAGGTAGPIIIKKRNLDTGEESEVVKTSGPYDLSPDGREVVFQVDGAVKTVSLNGGEPRELFRGLAQYYRLRWTRDGRYIIAQAAEQREGVGITGAARSRIWRVPAQGGTPLKLDLSVPNLDYFVVNPDNRRFAFSVNGGSKYEVWVLENFLPALARTPAR